LSIWGILQYGSGLLLTDPNAPIAFATTENVKHTLLDGSVVTLRPNSSLYKIEESESRMTYKLEGEALFEVERDGGRMFEIRAGDAVVEVLGTTFSVRDWRDEVEVYVESGRVWVGDVGVTGRGAEARSNGSGQDNGSGRESGSEFENNQGLDQRLVRRGVGGVELGAGEFGRRTGDGEWGVSAVRGGEILGWVSSEIVFQERSLSDIITELEHHFSTKILYPEGAGEEIISGRIHLADVRQALRDLSLVSGNSLEIAPKQP